jgi:hypothetical protein
MTRFTFLILTTVASSLLGCAPASVREPTDIEMRLRGWVNPTKCLAICDDSGDVMIYCGEHTKPFWFRQLCATGETGGGKKNAAR